VGLYFGPVRALSSCPVGALSLVESLICTLLIGSRNGDGGDASACCALDLLLQVVEQVLVGGGAGYCLLDLLSLL